MGGPSAGLLTAHELDLGEVLGLLGGFCAMECDEFRVLRPEAVGLPGLAGAADPPFALDPWPLEDGEFDVLDPPPGAELGVVAFTSGAVSHRLLGHLVLTLARRFDALIDFNGLLGPWHREDALRLEAARRTVSGLPGRVWEVPYGTGGGRRWYGHVGDPEFLAAWLEHPEFQMVK